MPEQEEVLETIVNWKPCRCCGNSDLMQIRTHIWVDIGLTPNGPYVMCLECGTLSLANSDDYNDIVSAWNRRFIMIEEVGQAVRSEHRKVLLEKASMGLSA